MITVLRKEILTICKDRGTLISLLILPIAFIVLFSSIYGGATNSPNVETQFVPGMMVMFVFFIIITMLRSFTRERESGMLARLWSTPVKPINYLTGMWGSFIITVIIQCVILLGFGHIIYQLQIGNLISILAMIFALAVCATGIGLALSFLMKSESQGVVFTQIIIMGGAALGGLWFPTDMLPDFAQRISHLTPQYWAHTGLQDIIIRGASITKIVPNLSVLILFGLAGIAIALIRFRSYILSAVS